MSTVWTAPIAEAVSGLITEHGGSPDRLAQALTTATERAIKAGILAERERCAAIADDHADQHEKALPLYGSTDKDGGRGRQEGHINSGRDIAAAIRTPHPSPTAGA